MFTQAKMIMQSYKPLSLKKGMWFLGMQHKQMVVFELTYNINSPEQQEMYVQLNGYPVEPYLYIEGNPNVPSETFIIATPEEIGWFDEGDHQDDLRDISIKEINMILENSGHCEIEVEYDNLDDDEADEYIRIVPVLLQDKVTIRYEENYDRGDDEEGDYIFNGDEDWEDDDEDEDEQFQTVYMEKIKQKFTKLLFGESKPVESFSPGTKTTYPDVKTPNFNTWCKQLNVSRMYTK